MKDRSVENLLAHTHAARDVNTEHTDRFIDATTTCCRCRWCWFQHIRNVSELRNLFWQNVDDVLLFTELTTPHLCT